MPKVLVQMVRQLNKEILDKVSEIIEYIKNTPDFKGYLKTKELLDNMLEKEKMKREITFFIDSIFCDRKYSKEIKRAYENLKEMEKENKDLNTYYKFIEKEFSD